MEVRYHVQFVSVAFLIRYLRGIFAAFSSTAELRVLRGILALILGSVLLTAAGTESAPASDRAGASVQTAGLDASPGHLGAWLQPTEEGEEREPRNDSGAEEGAEELQQSLALLSDLFHPLHTLSAPAGWCGTAETEPHHEWIARLERPPCVRTVAPFI
jgi:hypothetical protein